VPGPNTHTPPHLIGRATIEAACDWIICVMECDEEKGLAARSGQEKKSK